MSTTIIIGTPILLMIGLIAFGIYRINLAFTLGYYCGLLTGDHKATFTIKNNCLIINRSNSRTSETLLVPTSTLVAQLRRRFPDREVEQGTT